MSYVVIARKYRPGTFASVDGQEAVTRTLRHAILRKRLGHALLFCGPRGVGKTSVARIFSRAINCLRPSEGEPCNVCEHCQEIYSGKSFAVQEIDGASHNGVDTVRDLIDQLRTPPPPGYAYKIYIIDEVHMLSVAAFNALLKSLEEPPPHALFILATTEVHKIPETVISRCQRYDFKSLSPSIIESSLKSIAVSENLIVEPAVFRLVARMADGSMRDAQSIFDRITLFSEEAVTEQDAIRLLGVSGRSGLFRLAESVCVRSPEDALSIFSDLCQQGIDVNLLMKDFTSLMRELLFVRMGAKDVLIHEGCSTEEIIRMERMISHLSEHDVQALERMARQGTDIGLRSVFPRFAFEATLVRMATRVPVDDLVSLIERFSASGADFSPSRSRGSSSVSAPGVSHQPKEPKATPNISGGVSLDWRAFVSFTEERGARMMAEHLKRLFVSQFASGTLIASGPEFSVKSLTKKDELERLSKLLSEFCGGVPFVVTLSSADFEERTSPELSEKKLRANRSPEEALMNHPNVQTLQTLFPGSQIENVTTLMNTDEGE